MTSSKDQRPAEGKKVKPRPLPDVLDRLLQQLHRRDQYLFFAQPVSEKDVPDYHFHIKRPMDLGTMQSKFERGLYTTLDAFKEDFLLVTRNAQYYNLLEGPSAIVHTEAKRLEEWGLKALEKEAPAVEEALRLEQEQKLEEQRRRRIEQESQQASPSASVSRSNGGRLSLKIRKNSSWSSSGPGTPTPRVSTPSRLQNEIKLERDGTDDDETESRSDFRNGTAMDLDEAKVVVDDSEVEADDDKDAEDDDDDDDDEDDDEDDDDDDDDDDEDDEDDDDDRSVSHRAGSLSFDETGSERAPRSSTIIRVKKKRRSGVRRSKKGMFKKGQQRESAIVKLLSVPNIGFGDDKAPPRRPLMAPVSTTSAAVASYLQLTYRPDGSIDLDALLDDERRTLLRPAGLDAWPDLLTPFLHSLVPLHPDILPNAQSLARDVKQMIDGFGTAIAGMALSPFVSYSYDLFGRSAEQQKLPFAITSGWMFDSQDSTKIPAAWPRLAPSNASSEKDGKGDAQQPGVRPPRKDKERERDEEGLATLDDWTWPRAHLSRLQEALDVGLYPGLLPAAWISHINSQKGGPSRSRLPPFHLASGTAFDSAILDELASLPHRALLGGKPGIISVSASQPSASPMDVTVALEQAAERDWMPRPADLRKLGARGSDVVREAVYGGPVGEAYASSLEEFVRGASRSAEETFEDESEDEEEERARRDGLSQSELAAGDKVLANTKGPSSYFDENGEMLEQDAYIGVDLIPLEIRKDAGVALEPSRNTSVRPSPIPTIESSRGQKRSRSHSTFTPPPKKQFTEELAHSSRVDDGTATLNRNEETKIEEGVANPQSMEIPTDSEPTSQPLSDPLLEKPLIEFVRDLILTPLTQGQLATLVEIGEQFRGSVNGTPTRLDGQPSLSSDVKQENGPSSLQENNKFVEMRNETVRQAVRGEHFRGRLQMTELIRAQGNAMDIDKIARNQGDIQAALTLEASPLEMYADDAIPHPRTSDVEMILARYAGALEKLAAMDAEQGIRTTEQQIEREKQLERLRSTYIALAKRASKLHVVLGQWSKWLDAAQKRAEGGMAPSA